MRPQQPWRLRDCVLKGVCYFQVAEAQEAAQEAKDLVQEQSAVANEVRRQAEEAKSEAGPLQRQVEQTEQQVSATVQFFPLPLTLQWAWKCASPPPSSSDWQSPCM